METQREAAPSPNVSLNVRMPLSRSLCSKHWQPVSPPQWKNRSASPCQERRLEADAQNFSATPSKSLGKTSIYAAAESNTQTQVLPLFRLVSRRRRTICFVSEAIWSERSHQGAEQRVEPQLIPSVPRPPHMQEFTLQGQEATSQRGKK